MADVLLPVGTKVVVDLVPIDENDDPAEVDGAIVWSSSDEAVAVINVLGADGRSAEVVRAGAGVATITYSADADLSEGVEMISDSFTVEGEAEPPPPRAVDFLRTISEPMPI